MSNMMFLFIMQPLVSWSIILQFCILIFLYDLQVFIVDSYYYFVDIPDGVLY